MMKPQESYQRIIEKLASLRRLYLSNALIFGSSLLIIASLAWISLSLALEHLFWLPPIPKLILVGLAILTCSYLLLRFSLRPLIKRPSLQDMALMVEGRFPQLANRLVATLQLWEKKRSNPEGYSLQMVDANTLQAGKLSLPLNWEVILERQPTKRMIRLALLLGIGFLLVVGLTLFPTLPTLSRLAHPLTRFQRPLQTIVEVNPGDARVLKSSDLLVEITARGKTPRKAHLLWGREKESWREEELTGEGRFTYLFKNIEDSLQYQARAGDAQSPIYWIRVTERPKVLGLNYKYTYPSYTRLGTQELADEGNIEALVGTAVDMRIRANKSLKSVQLVVDNKLEIKAQVEENIALARIRVRKDRTYYIKLLDREGYENRDPIVYRIKALEDLSPSVKITEPGEDRDLTEDMLLSLRIIGNDDYGLSKLFLKYQVRSGETIHPLQKERIEFEQGKTLQVDWLWDLSQLGLMPEDVVTYWAEVWDNDLVSGPKKGQSKKYTVRFPSLEEIISEVMEEEEGQIVDLEDVVRQGRELSQRLDQIAQDMLSPKKMDWEERKEVQALLEKQQKMAQQLEDLSQRMQQTLDKVERNQLASPEVLEKLSEVQRLLEEVSTPELRRLMDKIREAIEKLNKDRLSSQMANYQISQKEITENLERTLKLLKRIQIEERLDTAVKLAERLAKQQEELNKKTAQSSKEELPSLAEEQSRLQEGAQSLQNQLQNLSQMMSEFPQMPSQQMAQLAKSMDELLKDMEGAKQSLSQGNKSQCQAGQSKIGKSLSRLSSNLSSLQNMFMAQQNRQALEEMKKAKDAILFLSKRQEELMGACKSPSNPSTLNQLAEDQYNLSQSLTKVANQIFRTSEKSTHISPQLGRNIGNSLKKMGQATKDLERGSSGSASRAQSESMASLNKAVIQLQQACQSMCSCSGGGGMQQLLQQLQALAEGQASLNQETLAQLQKALGGNLSRLAAQQEAMRKSLEELQREFGERSEILGRMGELAGEMKKVEEELAKHNLDRTLIDRQQRILSRLLDAQRSLHRRDYSRKRRATPGQEIVGRSPSELPSQLTEKKTYTKEDLIRALGDEYPPEYRELIKAYFEALSKSQ